MSICTLANYRLILYDYFAYTPVKKKGSLISLVLEIWEANPKVDDCFFLGFSTIIIYAVNWINHTEIEYLTQAIIVNIRFLMEQNDQATVTINA